MMHNFKGFFFKTVFQNWNTTTFNYHLWKFRNENPFEKTMHVSYDELEQYRFMDVSFANIEVDRRHGFRKHVLAYVSTVCEKACFLSAWLLHNPLEVVQANMINVPVTK